MVGDGPERAALEAEVAGRAMGARVRFAGWRTDVLDLVAAADIVVQPTLHEAFSQAMVEAMATGVCLVATDGGALPEVTGRDGDTVLQCRAGDADDLVRALRRGRGFIAQVHAGDAP